MNSKGWFYIKIWAERLKFDLCVDKNKLKLSDTVYSIYDDTVNVE